MNRARILIIAWCILVSLPPGSHAQRPTEYEVKAAFLYNFAKFVEWPSGAFEDADAPIVIGILGKDPFGPILEQTVGGNTAGGRSLKIRQFARIGDGLKRCHILFISRTAPSPPKQVMERIEGSSVLTVGEVDAFCQDGGIVNFVLQQNRVRFEINPDAAARAGLKISSRLLKLARIVGTEQRKERK